MSQESGNPAEVTVDENKVEVCPHCQEKMKRMAVPEMAQWDSPWVYVCFNDDCSYFVRGWEWMQSQYAVSTSYRYKLDPFTGEKGPLPVWSSDALKINIIDDKKEIGDE